MAKSFVPNQMANVPAKIKGIQNRPILAKWKACGPSGLIQGRKGKSVAANKAGADNCATVIPILPTPLTPRASPCNCFGNQSATTAEDVAKTAPAMPVIPAQNSKTGKGVAGS